VKGATVTIDAMGCQYSIADKIVALTGQYILSLKGNQGNLYDDVATYLSNEELLSSEDIKSFKDHDKGHGRIETRQCWVTENVGWLRQRHPQWSSIVSIVRIDSKREIKGKVSEETRYYISSIEANPKKILTAVRGHWSIENNLHWVLDMSFGEDQSRIRKHNAPQVMAIIRHIALNLLQLMKSKMKRQSIKRLRKVAGWDDRTLSAILVQRVS
jgi:predicted transposase YbfD/YdcC